MSRRKAVLTLMMIQAVEGGPAALARVSGAIDNDASAVDDEDM